MQPPTKTNYVRQDVRSESLVWTINRPERANAIGPAIAAEILLLLKAIEHTLSSKKTPKPRVLILRAATQSGQRGRVWIAGGDLKELANLTPAKGHQYSATMLQVCQRLEQLPIPVIAVLDGAAIGGGAELALAADIRVATAEGSFEFKQLKVGLATGFGGTRRLVDLVGKSHAQHLLLTSATVDAHRSLALGLIHEIIDETRLDARVDELAQQLTQVDANALNVQKQMLTNAGSKQSETIDRKEQSLFKTLWGKHAHRDFLQRFLKKT